MCRTRDIATCTSPLVRISNNATFLQKTHFVFLLYPQWFDMELILKPRFHFVTMESVPKIQLPDSVTIILDLRSWINQTKKSDIATIT